MNWLRRLFAKPAIGVLFGLDPPKGCHFDVSCFENSSWHVRIVRWGKDLAHECELIDRFGRGVKTDEDLIVAAAKKALYAYDMRGEIDARKRVVRSLSGSYPPKSTSHGIAKGKGSG
ncbi:hypothetical protein [Noviluteimonas gilva]|uniref:Uncharacterized protein n=1 Tax=Noviluteimonas gilva TaxID=2682097 RepID=A0A7C9MLK0_9GAMM|nr:hypothetical protein [Lysobacter gilvus]MUV13567.1 hypothetical protein [Lysobacter gilvus]